jgi:hypothetical protein
MASALRPWFGKAAIGVACVGVAGGVAWSSLTPQKAAGHASAPSASAATSTAPRAVPAPLDARAFTAELSSRVHSGPEALVDVALSATWKLTRLNIPERAPGRAMRFGAELDVTELRLVTSPESEERVRTALAEPVVFDVTERGLIAGIGFAKGEQPDAAYALSRGLVRALVGMLQIAAPADDKTTTWAASELDFTGPYEATYERTSPHTIKKQKQTYAACTTCGPAQVETRIVRSHITYELASVLPTLLAVRAVEADEATQVQGGAPLPDLSSETKVKLRLTSADAVDADTARALAERLQDVRLQALDNRGLDKRALLDDAKIAGTTFSSLADQISRLDGQGQRTKGPRARAFAQLTTHLRYDPSAVNEAVRRIRAGDPLRDTLIDALGSAGSEAAQSALRDLFADPSSTEDDRQNVILALSLTPKPSDGTTKLLGSLQDDPVYGRQSRYGLGIAAYHLDADEPARAASIVTGLESRLASAGTHQEAMEFLRALGNAAHPSSLGAIKRYLTHDNASVRSAAMNALRRIPGSQADEYLAAALLSDESPGVRLSAATALGYRTSSSALVRALQTTLGGEPEREVRLQATRVAARWASNEPVLRDVLARVARHDPDPKIRDVAGTAGSG